MDAISTIKANFAFLILEHAIAIGNFIGVKRLIFN